MRATAVVLALGFLLVAGPAGATPTNIVDHSPVSPVETGSGPPPPPPPTPPPIDTPHAGAQIPFGAGMPTTVEATPVDTDKPKGPTRKVSYRKYTLAIDGFSVAMILTGRLIGGKDPSAIPQAIATVGLIGGAFGSPALHGARGHAERAARSMGLRIGAGAAGLFVQSKFTDCGGFRQCLDPSGPGIVIAAVTASAIDALFMTSERVPLQVAKPVALATPGGAMLGLAGTF